MSEGWIKISRRLQEHWLWQDAELLKWWLDLLLLASYEDKKVLIGGKLQVLKRGQMAVSTRFLQNRWARHDKDGNITSMPGLHRIQNFIKMLEQEEMIYRDLQQHQNTILSICNYERYQATDELHSNTCGNTLDNTCGNKTKNIKNNNSSLRSELSATSICEMDASAGSDERDWLGFFNGEMEAAKAAIPRLKKLTTERCGMLSARIKENGAEAVEEVIRKAASSSFLNGGGDRGFRADFNWLMRPRNFIKILEGNYDNDKQNYDNGIKRQQELDRRRGSYYVTAKSGKDYEGSF